MPSAFISAQTGAQPDEYDISLKYRNIKKEEYFLKMN